MNVLTLTYMDFQEHEPTHTLTSTNTYKYKYLHTRTCARTYLDVVVQADCYEDQCTDRHHHFIVDRTHVKNGVFTLNIEGI